MNKPNHWREERRGQTFLGTLALSVESSTPKLKENTRYSSGDKLRVMSNANGFVLFAVSEVDCALLLGLYCSVSDREKKIKLK